VTSTLRYPKKLTELNPDESYTAKNIATILDVAERTVYRWFSQGFLERDVREGVTLYTPNPLLKPEAIAAQKGIKRQYTDTELETFYQDILSGEISPIPIDITQLIRSRASNTTLISALDGLNQFREFLAYVIKR
jgi:hypothetical protein